MPHWVEGLYSGKRGLKELHLLFTKEDLEGKITSLNYAMGQHLNVQPIRDSPVHDCYHSTVSDPSHFSV